MSTVDIVILVCFVPGIIRGISKGLVDQVIAIVSLVLGAWLAFKFSSWLTGILDPYVEISNTVLNVISFALILIAVILLMKILGSVTEKLLKVVMLDWLDKLLGFVFALLVNALVIGLVILLFDSINSTLHIVKAEVLDSSVLYGSVKAVAMSVFPYLKQLFMKS